MFYGEEKENKNVFDIIRCMNCSALHGCGRRSMVRPFRVRWDPWELWTQTQHHETKPTARQNFDTRWYGTVSTFYILTVKEGDERYR